MTEGRTEVSVDGSLARLGRIIAACDRFEDAWRGGPRPRVEDYLPGAPEADDQEWLRRLLSLEIALRRERGEAIDPGEYRGRFPDGLAAVEAALGEQTEASTGGGRPPGGTPPGDGHDLLLGLLALHNGLIDQPTLVGAIRARAPGGRAQVGTTLGESGHLDAGALAVLEALVAGLRGRHGDDPRAILAAIGPIEALGRALARDAGPEVRAALAVILPTRPTEGPREPTTAWDGDGSGDADQAGPPPGPRYRVLRFHRAGNLGKVSLARDLELRRDVAFKEIREDKSSHAAYRHQFLLEALVTGGLEHPGIVPVYGLGSREDGGPYYAMKFIRGPSLGDKLRQLHGQAPTPPGEEPPTLPRLVRHFISACHAMAYAHNRGVLHRDLKPEHVMLGPFGETLVVDWGLAMPYRGGDGPARPEEEAIRLPKDVESVLSPDGWPVGTPHYMSPEQARGENSRLDPRSDIYGLGATLYCLLTGRSPHKGREKDEALEKARAGDFPAPGEVRPGLPPVLEAICLKAMRPLPADRYPTATELARDLERWLDDEPTTAYPEPWPDRAARWIRRHRTAAAAAATLLVATSLALGVGTVVIGGKNRQLAFERDRAEASGREARENFDLARAVVQKMLSRIASSSLPRIPGADQVRAEVAAEASQYLDALMRKRPTDPGVRYDAARSYRELGKVRQVLGDARATASFEAAIRILEALIREFPDAVRYPDYLIETTIDKAEALQMAGSFAQAGPSYQRALDLSGRALARSPGDPATLRTRFGAFYNAAGFRSETGDLAESIRLSGEAIPLLRPLADAPRPNAVDRTRLALALAGLGNTLREAGRPAEARVALDESLRRAESLPDDGSGHRDSRMIQVAALLARGRLPTPDEAARLRATADLDRAVEGSATLAGESRQVAHYQARWADALTARAEFREAVGELSGAADDAAKAAGIVEELLTRSTGHPVHSGRLGRAVACLGRLALARGGPGEAVDHLRRAIGLLEVAQRANPGNFGVTRRLHECGSTLDRIPATRSPGTAR